MEFKKYKICEIAEVIGGGTPSTKKAEYYGDDIPWITPKDLSNYKRRYIACGERSITDLGLQKSSAKLLPTNTVLFTSRAPIGYVAIAKNEISTNQGFKSLICNKELVLPEYLYYLMKYNTPKLEKLATGSTFKEVSGSIIKNFEIELPNIIQQEKIINILWSLDSKIELNLDIINNLEQLSQSLFKHWFIDFEFPNEEGKPYKSSGGEMVESELGEIPRSFKVGILSDIYENFDFKRKPLSKMERLKREKIYPYYGAASLMDFVDDYLFDGLYLLLGEDGTVQTEKGYPVLQLVDGKFWVNNHAHVMQGLNGFLTEYLYIMLKHINIKNIITGAVQPKISQRNLNNIKIIIPDEKSSEVFQNKIKLFFKEILNLREENQNLQELRDTLLPKLLSGEIEIPDDLEM